MFVPGDAPALVEVEITPSGGAAAPIWAAIGWWPRPSVFNQCWNGDFESAVLAVEGWSVAAVTNISGAATSIFRVAVAAKYGGYCGQIVCPATADTGASFRIFRRFKKGVTYTAEAWIHSAAGVTNTYIRLGNGAANDKASSGNIALSTAWQRITVTWTPSADRDDAHVAVNIAAATGTTFEIDGVMVYEGTVAPASANQSEGRGGFPPVGVIEAENGCGTGTGATLVASANYRSGFGASIGGGLSLRLLVDPALLVPDDYTQSEIAIEVWARVNLPVTPVTLLTYAKPLSAAALPKVYTDEFGSAGKPLTPPSSGTALRFVRAGTLRLSAGAGRYQIFMNTGATSVDLDYLLLLPANQRALSPSGKANDATFPIFIPDTSELTKRIRSDLSGTIKDAAGGVGEVDTSGLGGFLLEFPPGDIDTVVKLSSLVPDDPTSNTTTEQLAHSATVHFAVTPRWRLGRSS
jgi:hypothetical protein